MTEAAREDPRLRYTCEPMPGLSRARNHGLARARFELVAFTDDDTLPDPNWAAALLVGFALDPGAACVTGPVASGALDSASERYFDMRYSWAGIFEPRRYDMADNRDPSPLYPFRAASMGTGANFAVRSRVVTQLGGFDPLLGAGSPAQGGEDMDMFLRLVLTGSRICYLPSALVWHRHRADTQALRQQLHSYGRGLGAYMAKHLGNGEFQSALRQHGLRHARTMLGQMRRPPMQAS